MPYPHPLRIEGLLYKEETIYSTDPTPTPAADGVRGVGRLWTSVNPEWAFPNMREDTVSGSLVQAAPGTPAGRFIAWEYTIQLMGAGAAYSSSTPVRPECDAFFMSCAQSRAHVDTGSSETVTYALADTGHSSGTAWAYAGGKVFKINGCKGTWIWSPTAGGLGQITFRMMGILASVAEASLPSITYDSAVPPPAVNMSLAVVPNGGSSWTPDVANMTVELGNEVVRLDDVNAANGIGGFYIVETKPRFTFTPRVVDLSDYPAYALAAARTDHTIDMTLGSAQYNRVNLDVNLAYLEKDPGGAEDNKVAAWNTEYMLRHLALVFD